MEIKSQYPINVEEWKQESKEHYLFPISCSLSLKVELTKPDIFNGCFDFYVGFDLKHYNSLDKQILSGITVSTFAITYQKDAPTLKFLFELIDISNTEFTKVFQEKTRGTNLYQDKIPSPEIAEVAKRLQEDIDKWDAPAKEFKTLGRENSSTFRDLPVIPEAKQFQNENHYTMEQFISYKLLTKKRTSIEELKIFDALSLFYSELNDKLSDFDYSSLSHDELLPFKNYILFAFRTQVLLSHMVKIDRLYRLVVNEEVSEQNKSITDITFLKYPSLDKVKQKHIFNRGNTPESTVFYAAQSVDAAIKEVRPPLGKLVSVGIWVPKFKTEFIGYPIIHSDLAIAANEEVSKANSNAGEMEKEYHPSLLKFIHHFIKLLSREYSKPINHKYDYLISGIFSEDILKVNDVNKDFNFECILYPSVGNSLKTFNFAIKPSAIENDFKLVNLIEFEVAEAFYDNSPAVGASRDSISLANIRKYRETQNISSNGMITW